MAQYRFEGMRAAFAHAFEDDDCSERHHISTRRKIIMFYLLRLPHFSAATTRNDALRH